MLGPPWLILPGLGVAHNPHNDRFQWNIGSKFLGLGSALGSGFAVGLRVRFEFGVELGFGFGVWASMADPPGARRGPKPPQRPFPIKGEVWARVGVWV